MKNPYEILGISQDATKEEIQKAFVKVQVANVKLKKYDGRDLMEARNQLMKPEKRLVADFLFPAKFKSKRPKLIEFNGLEFDDKINIDTLDEELFDSLNDSMHYV